MKELQGIVAQMSLEEKAALVTGATTWSTTPIDRLDLPALVMTDGPHGVRKSSDLNSFGAKPYPATAFPTATVMACTWDVELVEAVGIAIGEECVALGVNVILGPGVNIKRSPLCGRNFEYYSEDPFLAGCMGVAFVNGVQSQGVGTSLKHFAANNQETQRMRTDTIVDERTLREIYLPAFEMTVKQAQPWSVMCAYNRLNGEFCSEHHTLLTDILRGEWGFEGFVVSDWGAVHDRVAALRGGLDLEMPGPRARRTQAVVDAVNEGELDESILDESVRRILRITLMADDAHPQSSASTTIDFDAHHALARQVAAEGMVLLKNDGLLPLKPMDHLAVIGRAARVPQTQGGGSSHINASRKDIPLDELRRLAGDAEVSFSEGYTAEGSASDAMIAEAVQLASESDVALIFVALPPSKESEGYDRPDLGLMEAQDRLIKAVVAVQPKTVVILNSASAIDMRGWIDDVPAVLEAWMTGQGGGRAMADVLFGRVNPSGKLAETFALRIEDTPAYLNFPGENGVVRYGEGIFVGYRYYDARKLDVLFPFGHGLSYTTFEYSDLRVSATTFRDMDGLLVTVDVTNSGTVAGKEIVQLYIADKAASVARPPKELKGFVAVRLEPGETKAVAIALDMRAFAFFQTAHHDWVTETGDFEVLVGASSADIRLRSTVTLESTVRRASLLNTESTVGEWLADAQGAQVAGPMLQQILKGMSAAMGQGADADGDATAAAEGQDDDEGVGMDLMGFIMEMPLLGLLQFNEQALPQPSEVLVAGLLAQLDDASETQP